MSDPKLLPFSDASHDFESFRDSYLNHFLDAVTEVIWYGEGRAQDAILEVVNEFVGYVTPLTPNQRYKLAGFLHWYWEQSSQGGSKARLVPQYFDQLMRDLPGVDIELPWLT